MSQPRNLSQLESARAKQQAVRRKMQSLPRRAPRPELANVNWHEQYMKRVAK